MNIKALLYGLIVILALSLIFGYFVTIQSAWMIEGKVIDYSGEPIHHATVTFTNYEETFKVITDEHGHYAILNNFLKQMEEGKYHVIATKSVDKEDFVGYEGDYEVKRKNAHFDIFFKDKKALGVHQHILGIMRGKFGDLRAISSPSEPEAEKMKYGTKSEPIEDTVDLKDLGEYYIEMGEKTDEHGQSIVHIDLKYKDKVVEEGDVILNCSLFAGWTRPEGHHKELWNSIGLDEVTNRLTEDDGIIKIWTKYTWQESGDRFSDVIISPLNLFSQRTGKSKSFFSFTGGVASKFSDVRPKPSGDEGGASSAPPSHVGEIEAIEVDLSQLGEYTIQIYNPNPAMNKFCINLMKGEEVEEKGICVSDSNVWTSKGETNDDEFRIGNIFQNLKNTLGLVGVGKKIDENTYELSTGDGIVYMMVGKAYVPGCTDCKDVTIVSKGTFDKYQIIVSREYEGDKNIVWCKDRWLLG